MSRFAVDDKDTDGREGDPNCLRCFAVQRVLDYRVRYRFLRGDRILRISFKQESGYYLLDIIHNIFGFRFAV